ncbi:hypothetical protein SNE26_19415 [Mucilaginibacter sp. cycad4]|uniref:hypothetical protein n=1 Tax=Mucilaginibacter sp. cycad4 TaxID=3342096 RepID=UPI002AAC37B1|nr:hypothetical protein [Mucilaginibacter gossypii]WPU98195.1 hypothetical protein SNE26_19415 [Mucilaginibacter gossypii]
MQLKEPISNLLEQLQYVIDELSPLQYTQPVKLLSQSSIGQHTRHILEFFIELNKGYETGMVDYDKRIRNKAIEADRDFAITTIRQVEANIQKPDKELILQAEYGESEAHSAQVFSNYYRELVYNLEHTVHHMALIRIGVNAISDVVIPDEFGVAASTLKYRKACAQ